MKRRTGILAAGILTVSLGFAGNGVAAVLERVLAPDGTTEDRFGYSVAISGDTAIVSAPGDSPQGSQSGSVYVFTLGTGGWTQQAKLTASDGVSNASFGQQVGISGDLVVVGAPYAVVSGTITGAAYVFARSGTTWTQQAKLTAGDAHPFDYFGSTVSISGTTAVIGSPYGDVFDADSGATYVFTASAGVWSQQAKIFPADGRTGDLFGASVALSGDTMVAGAPSDDDDAIASGSAYVYQRTGVIWQLQQKLHPADRADGDQFGSALALNANTLVVGAPDRDDLGIASGAAYVYLRGASIWAQSQKLLAPDGGPGDFFGASVAVSPNGALVGAFLDDDGASDTGSVYPFERRENAFVAVDKLLAFDRAGGDNFGVSVALSDHKAIIGSEQSDARGSNAGAAYATVLFASSVPATRPLLLSGLLVLLLGLGAAVLGTRGRATGLSPFRSKTVSET